MEVNIQSLKFDADKQLVAFIEDKMEKLERFVENVIAADVFLKIDKNDETKNKVATIRLTLGGGELIAERQAKTFEEAVDLSIDAIKKQVDKFKEKQG